MLEWLITKVARDDMSSCVTGFMKEYFRGYEELDLACSPLDKLDDGDKLSYLDLAHPGKLADIQRRGSTKTLVAENGDKKISDLPNEIIIKILSGLPAEQLGKVAQVNKQLKAVSEDVLQRRIVSEQPIGREAWEQSIGQIAEAPPLPEGIGDILTAPCPFWAPKQVWQTHRLVLLPKSVSEKSYSPELMNSLVKKPIKGCPTQVVYVHSSIADTHWKASSKEAYWALVTKDVLPGTRNKNLNEQQAIILLNGKGNYRLPKLAEVVTTAFLQRVREGECLFSSGKTREETTYTVCAEKAEGQSVIVGRYDKAGLRVLNDTPPQVDIGAAAVRRFTNVYQNKLENHLRPGLPA